MATPVDIPDWTDKTTIVATGEVTVTGTVTVTTKTTEPLNVTGTTTVKTVPGEPITIKGPVTIPTGVLVQNTVAEPVNVTQQGTVSVQGVAGGTTIGVAGAVTVTTAGGAVDVDAGAVTVTNVENTVLQTGNRYVVLYTGTVTAVGTALTVVTTVIPVPIGGVVVYVVPPSSAYKAYYATVIPGWSSPASPATWMGPMGKLLSGGGYQAVIGVAGDATKTMGLTVGVSAAGKYKVTVLGTTSTLDVPSRSDGLAYPVGGLSAEWTGTGVVLIPAPTGLTRIFLRTLTLMVVTGTSGAYVRSQATIGGAITTLAMTGAGAKGVGSVQADIPPGGVLLDRGSSLSAVKSAPATTFGGATYDLVGG